MSDMGDTQIGGAAITTVPAGSATVILFDSTADPGKGTTLTVRRGWGLIKRGIVRIFTDQAATFYHDSLVVSSTTWDTVNGGGSGEAIAINTLFERDCLFIGDDTRFRVVTGTVPTVWRVSVRLSPDRALGQ